MKEFPTISTPRFDLIRPDVGHAEDVFRYGSDSEFCRYIDAKPFADTSDAESFLAGLLTAIDRGERVYWAVRDRQLGSVIGTLGFIEVSWRHGVAEFGFGIARSHWGRGVFHECALSLFGIGRESLGIERLEMRTRADNQNAIRACLRAGFKEEAVLRSYYRPQGENMRVDAMQMSRSL